jgi:hypothetical protein
LRAPVGNRQRVPDLRLTSAIRSMRSLALRQSIVRTTCSAPATTAPHARRIVGYSDVRDAVHLVVGHAVLNRRRAAAISTIGGDLPQMSAPIVQTTEIRSLALRRCDLIGTLEVLQTIDRR